MTTKITLHKGGTAERTIDLRSHSVPDAWHAAQRLRSQRTQNVAADVMAQTDANLIIELWHLAHAMRDHIINEDRAPYCRNCGEEFTAATRGQDACSSRCRTELRQS